MYGMIGGGRGAFIGAVHRKAIALDTTARLVAGAMSSTPENAITSALELGIARERAYASWRDMLTAEAALPPGERIDFVSIVTPNDTHHPIAKAALEHGFHVVLDKPATHTSAQARELADLARARGLLCCVTYNYSGYPMVRQAAEMVASGELGAIRKVVVEYHQGWLAAPLEQTGQKQAAWRTDPKRSGGGAIGDIGVHAEQLARFITGLEPVSLCADITTHVPGRQVDDDGCVLLKYPNGARGSISFSQVCVGEQNGLSIRVFGERGGLRWRQESPDELVVLSLDSPTRLLTRGGPGLGARAAAATRIPPGHPEGYLEGFANIYRGVAEWIMCARANKPTGPLAREIPTIEDGLKGVRFMELAVQSSALGGVWAGTRT